MKKIKITKTIEEISIDKAVGFCLRVLKKPEKIPQKDWPNKIKKDLITGRKFIKIRELTLKGIDNNHLRS